MIAQPPNPNSRSATGGLNSNRRFERFGGLSYEVIVSKYEHGALGMKFHNWIRNHVKHTGPLNITPLARSGPQQASVAPDLGIYIIGITESFASITARILRDLRNGSQVIWVISPEEESVIVYSRKGMRLLGMQDMLEGGDVLPGFMLPVVDIINGA